MILSGANLTVRYPGSSEPALEDVSLRLSTGELLAVVGPNGSGKTTLVRALLGLQRTERGRVELAGKPIAQWSRSDLARTVGVVTQREESVFALTVAEMVLLGRYPHLGALEPAGPADRAAVRSALERCDAWSLRDRATDTLSGGEWQRVRIARALAQEPRLLVLDEPTIALDVRHEMELFELVRHLADGGLAAMIITHQLNLAARFADRVLLLSRGRVAAEGPPAAVLTRDTLSDVFQWPVAVTSWRDGSPQVVALRPSEAGLTLPIADRNSPQSPGNS